VHHLDFAAVSHRGVVPAVNQDSIVAVPPVFLVADGIGGADAGEVASSIVAGEFAALARDAAGDPLVDTDLVGRAMQQAHEDVRRLSRTLPNGAASTAAGCVALEVDGRSYWMVFNVGDSRVYRCHGPAGQRRIKQVSVDHSLVQEMVDAGTLSRNESYGHPDKNVVTRAVGAEEGCEPDFWMLPMVSGERFLICSDGLLGDSPAAEVRELVKASTTAAETVEQLLELALRSGARDNVSVVVIDVASDEEGDDEPTTVIAHRTVISQRGTTA